MEYAYILTVKVAPQDKDLLESKVADIIRDRFTGTAITFVECSPFPDKEIAVMTKTAFDAGYATAIRKMGERN